MAAGFRTRPRARRPYRRPSDVTPVDPGTPGPPINVAAVAVSQTTVAVSWEAPPGYDGIAAYRVYRDNAIVATVTELTFTDTGRTPGSTLRYAVVAVNGTGVVSTPSTTVTVTTPTAPTADTTPPSAPTGLTATAASATSINLGWAASTDDTAVVGYRIFRGATLITQQPGRTFTDAGLTASTAYTYTVQAYDAAGNVSASSASASATTQAPPPTADTTAPTAPTGLTATATSATTINLAWAASTDNVAVTGYRVYRGTTQIVQTTARTYTDSALPSGTAQTYTVRALDAAGNLSAASSSATATTPAVADTTPPSAPTGLTATATSSTAVSLKWTAATDNVAVVKYQVFRGTTLVTEATGLTHVDSGRTASTTYTYTVRAVDGAGNLSPASAAASATTPAATGGSNPFAQAPAQVTSYGPNGTHWPADTPWYKSTSIPNVIEVDCTWAAIKTGIQSFTAAQVEAGAVVRVRPGSLPGGGSGNSGTSMMTGAGSDAWNKRLLVRPRDGYGTVIISSHAKVQNIKGVCFAGFTGRTTSMGFYGCTNSAVAFSSFLAVRIAAIGGTNPTTNAVTGTVTENFDCYEVVCPDITVGDIDPANSSSGNPGGAGDGGGNGWLKDCKVIGCYVAPQYLPVDAFDSAGNKTAGYGHNDSWQFQGAGYYWGFYYQDTALWGSNNSALQIGGYGTAISEAGAADYELDINAFYGLPAGTKHQFLTLDHCLLVDAGTGAAVRYPRPAGTKDFTVTNCINGGGGYGRMDMLNGTRTRGPFSSVQMWRVVDPTVRISPGTSAKILPGGGAWTADPAMATWTAADYDAICPMPTDSLLTSIWT